MKHQDPLDQQIARTLNTVAAQVPVRDRLAELTAGSEHRAARRWRFSQIPALAGVAAFLVGIVIVGGGLLALRNNTNEPSGPAIPAVTTTTTTTTTTTPPADIVAGAGGPCVDAHDNLIGESGIQILSGGRSASGRVGPSSIGYCPGHPRHGETAHDNGGSNFNRPIIHVEPGAEMVLVAPGYPGATVDLSWLHEDAPEPDPGQLTRMGPTTWTFTAPVSTSEFTLTVSLDWPEGEAQFITIVVVNDGESVTFGMPSDFDAGPELDAEIRSDLPPSYLRLGFYDALALMSIGGEPLGHIAGQPEAPVGERARTQLLTDEYVDWGVPEDCVVDAVVAGTHLRILCLSTDGSGPTVELLFGDGRREVIAQLTEPPSDLEGAVRLGRFLEVMPSPWNSGAALGQLSVECEARLAVMINDGVVYHLDRTPWWGDAYPDGESVAIGWAPDQRALVWRFNGGCSGGLAVPGVYIYGIDGGGELLFAVPDEVLWVEVVSPPEASDTAAIYPSWTAAELEAVVVGDGPLQEDSEVVAAFATDMLGVADPEVVGVGDATDSMSWEVAGDGFVASIWSRIIAWRADGTAINAITYASTFESDDGLSLSAQVENDAGFWTAEFRFPQIGDETTVVFSSADWTVQTTTSNGLVTLDLPEEPFETPRLTITYRTGGEVVGFHGTLLPAGEFAAG